MTGGLCRKILITGGAGFIGSNLAERLLLTTDARVAIYDDLSRNGVWHNLCWLRSMPEAARLQFIEGDVRNAAMVSDAARDVDEIYHFAAQVAVTTSVSDPRSDFEVNALGTLNVLEAARSSGRRPFVLFTSTNKVYGSLASVPVGVDGWRYHAVDNQFDGVDESEPLDFYSPYGCSKGAADQYVRDYSRIYDLPTVVLRMSCMAGPRQFGTEDQGWVAHFLYSLLEGRPVTVYGDGRQVRDVLHVHDLLDAMEAAYRARDRTAGQVYNIGGGIERSVSIRELLNVLTQETGIVAQTRYDGVRPGDQPLYISNTGKLSRETGWKATRSLRQTISSIRDFWEQNQSILAPERRKAMELVSEEVA